MFEWLRKRLGSVKLGETSYSFSQLKGMDPASLSALGQEAVSYNQFQGAHWAAEALMGQGGSAGGDLLPLLEALLAKDPDRDRKAKLVGRLGDSGLPAPALTRAAQAAREKGKPRDIEGVAQLHEALAASLGPKTDDPARVAAMEEILELARWALKGAQPGVAQRALERDMPRAAGTEKPSPEASRVLLEAAKVAQQNNCSKATIALLDRRLAFRDKDSARQCCLLLGAALGNGDKAISRLNEALKIDPEDVECHYLLGKAYTTRAKRARSQAEFDSERKKALEHLEKARERSGADDDEGSAAGVVLGAAGGVALLAMMAPVYDEAMYLTGPKKGAAAGSHSSVSE
jgi:tetratricopeptide (TPR) repeat protein